MASETTNAASEGGARNCQRGSDGSEHSRKTAKPATPIRVMLSGCYSASAAGITVNYEKRRRGSPICTLARKLVEAGHDPASPLMVYRDAALCFRPMPLARWAAVTVMEGDNTPRSAHFAPYRLCAPENARSGAAVGPLTGHPEASGSRVPEKATAALATGGTHDRTA